MKRAYWLASFVLIVGTVTGCGTDCDSNENETFEDNDRNNYISGVKVYPIETSCAMTGGICVHHKDCVTLASTQGLCPNNRHMGVECCYELPIRKAPCKQHLGACMNRCHRYLQRPATDCDGQVCCVLVN